MKSLEQYLQESALPRETIDLFLDPSRNTWARFDPIVGYTLGNFMPRDGIDGSSTISTAREEGMRTPHNYAHLPCRINTYGNSFTQCHQVSDGETWQEYLAAHLGEPIRNFGVGGFGTYQAFRRMMEIEKGDLGADYVILYIWGDDHFRSLMRCRYAVIYPWWDDKQGSMFHGNFWAHLEMDLDAGDFLEKDNLLATPESLYCMTDPDFMADTLRDDLILQLYVADTVDPSSLSMEKLDRLAEILSVEKIDPSTPGKYRQTITDLKKAYGFKATEYVVGKAADFCGAAGKKLMICLLCPTATRQLLGGQPRYDKPIADYLAERKEPVFDMNLVHKKDYRDFALSIEEYMKRYFIGHYSPAGNHLFAYSIKDSIVDWLDPKPVTYRDEESKTVSFDGYLPGSP